MRVVFEGFSRRWAEVSDLPVFDAGSRESALRSSRSVDCRGWVTTLREESDFELAGELPIPVLNYSNRLAKRPATMSVFPDEVEVGRLAAETFLAKGHRVFVAVGYEGFAFSDERIAAFSEHLGRAGKAPLVWKLDPSNRENPLRLVSTKRKLFQDWFAELELPAAIFCANDELAANVLTMAEDLLGNRAWLLSVAGVDDSPAFVGIHNLSSIRPNFPGVGKVLAETLAEALENGHWGKGRVQRVGGAKWMERETTWGGPGSRNPLVARCVRLVDKALACGDSPTVSTLAHELRVSRRTLLSRFRDSTDRTLRDYLIEERVRHAAKLLRETDRSIADIALSTGFSKQSNLSHRFREFHGKTPREFRQASQEAGSGSL